MRANPLARADTIRQMPRGRSRPSLSLFFRDQSILSGHRELQLERSHVQRVRARGVWPGRANT